MHTAMCWLMVGASLAMGADPIPDAARFSDKSIRFDYPRKWKVDSPSKNELVTVSCSLGVVLIQCYDPNVDPDVLITDSVSTLRKSESKIVKGSDKAIKRRIGGADRDGQGMNVEVAGSTSILRHEYFAFLTASKKRVVYVVILSSSLAGEEVKKGIELVVSSLADADGGLAEDVAVVALLDTAPKNWELKPVKVGAPLWKDRDYAISMLSKGLEGGTILMRDVGENREWPALGSVIAKADCRVYAIVRSKYLGKAVVDEATFRNLATEGWIASDQKAETTFNEGEEWGWTVLTRELKKGDRMPQLKKVEWKEPVVFIFR